MKTLVVIAACLVCLFSVKAGADVNSGKTVELNEVVVIGKLDKARNNIVPSLGASEYTISSDQITTQSQGDNAPFNQILLRAPGVAQDSYGQDRVRSEDGNLQYRINDVLLPEGITGFGQELDTRFAQNISLVKGTLPAQYGFRTAGIVDIHTKSGVFTNGGNVSTYGGSFNTMQSSLSYGGSNAKKDINYYVTGSYLENNTGLENADKTRTPIHDQTHQGKFFTYISKVLDDTSRLNTMVSSSYGVFQIPNVNGQSTYFDSNALTNPGIPVIDSSNLNERQTEQNYYGVLSYQKAMDALNFQVSAFTRYSEALFKPDLIGDLDYNGIASRVDTSIFTNGLQLDASYDLNDQHTLRAGSMVTISRVVNDSTSTVFPLDVFGDPQLPTSSIVDNSQKQGQLYGVYLQDEWKITEPLTINFGGRFDQSYQYINEYQFSPRVNAVYEFTKDTKMHAGYARYFTPAPFELIQNTDPHIFDNTSNAVEILESSPTKAERSHYFDVGLTHHFTPELQVGLDNYYKIARNQQDQAQFGKSLINVPINYAHGREYGSELAVTYKKGGFSGYSNLAWNRTVVKKVASGEFNFEQDELNYLADHWVEMDQSQSLTGSAGVSYEWKYTRVYTDILHGSGFRKGFANLKHVGGHNPVNLGIEHTFNFPNFPKFKARFDVVNVFDQTYQLRDGTGIGAFGAQYGQRRGFYGGLSADF
ncbi:MAG: TonB-dependent receptor [Candidatus Omnitrophota bacterium]